MSSAAAGTYEDARGANAGWVAGALVILAVFVIGGFFWFRYHP